MSAQMLGARKADKLSYEGPIPLLRSPRATVEYFLTGRPVRLIDHTLRALIFFNAVESEPLSQYPDNPPP